MAFTDQQAQAVIQAIQKKIGEGRAATCAICGHTSWEIQNQGTVNLGMVSDLSEGVLVVGGPTLPNIALICATCGNTYLINLFKLGLGETFGIKASNAGEQPTPVTDNIAVSPSPKVDDKVEATKVAGTEQPS